MAYIRTAKRENPFVQLDKYFIEDPNLSWEAKGILAYILSRPDNWKINQKDLVQRSTSGKTKVESALLELLANGYCNWYQEREESGQFGEWVYDVYERPEFNPKKDECIKIGMDRILSRKERIKSKNKKEINKKDEPKADYPKADYPKADYPKADYPKADYPTYNNININNNDLNNNDLNNNNLNNIVNKENARKELLAIADSFYIEYGVGRWDKKQWLTIINKVADEMVDENKHIDVPSENWERYVSKIIKNIAHRHDLKFGKLELDNKLLNTFNDVVFKNDESIKTKEGKETLANNQNLKMFSEVVFGESKEGNFNKTNEQSRDIDFEAERQKILAKLYS